MVQENEPIVPLPDYWIRQTFDSTSAEGYPYAHYARGDGLKIQVADLCGEDLDTGKTSMYRFVAIEGKKITKEDLEFAKKHFLFPEIPLEESEQTHEYVEFVQRLATVDRN